jgi:hypothetical protein
MDYEMDAYHILLGLRHGSGQEGTVKRDSPKLKKKSDQANKGSCVVEDK